MLTTSDTKSLEDQLSIGFRPSSFSNADELIDPFSLIFLQPNNRMGQFVEGGSTGVAAVNGLDPAQDIAQLGVVQ